MPVVNGEVGPIAWSIRTCGDVRRRLPGFRSRLTLWGHREVPGRTWLAVAFGLHGAPSGLVDGMVGGYGGQRAAAGRNSTRSPCGGAAHRWFRPGAPVCNRRSGVSLQCLHRFEGGVSARQHPGTVEGEDSRPENTTCQSVRREAAAAAERGEDPASAFGRTEGYWAQVKV